MDDETPPFDEDEFRLEQEPVLPFASLRPAARILDNLLKILILLCVVHIVARLLFINFMLQGKQPFNFSMDWIWLATATDDGHVLLGLACLYLLRVWLSKARKNVRALQIKGAISEENARNSALLSPSYFAFSYERVVVDLWRLTAARDRWNDSRGRPMWQIPFVWWILLASVVVVHIVYYDLSANYYGMSHMPGQIYVSQVSLVLFFTVIVIAQLTRLIIHQITEGQEKLSKISVDYRLRKQAIMPPSKPVANFLKQFFGLGMIIGSYFIAGYFVETYAPKVFIESAEQKKRNEVEEYAFNTFRSGNYKELESFLTDLKSNKRRTDSGRLLQELFYQGVQESMWRLSYEENGMPTLYRIITDWKTVYPRSPSASIAQATLFLIEADMAQDKAQYFKKLDEGIIYLNENRWVAEQDPEWSLSALQAIARKGDMNTFIAVAAQASKAYPDYFANYEQVVSRLAGTENPAEQIEAFAQVAASTPGGDMVYALVYWYALRVKYDNRLFAESRADWPRIKKGLDQLVQRYPSVWNNNIYARLSCLATDKDTGRPAMQAIQGQALENLWWSKDDIHLGDTYAICARWALME